MRFPTVTTILLLLALNGCEGIFYGKKFVNTADPSFTQYYQDNDRSYVPPRGYTPPEPGNPYEGTIPTLQQYYAHPTDNDAQYVSPQQPQPGNPADSPAMQQYYANPTDNDAEYVAPRPTAPAPGRNYKPAEQRYPDHDADYYPMIYDN